MQHSASSFFPSSLHFKKGTNTPNTHLFFVYVSVCVCVCVRARVVCPRSNMCMWKSKGQLSHSFHLYVSPRAQTQVFRLGR